MVFEHSGGRDFDLPRHSHSFQGLSLWSLNIVGGEILTFPDTLTPRSRLTHLLPPLSLHRLSIRLRRGRSTTSTESVAPGHLR